MTARQIFWICVVTFLLVGYLKIDAGVFHLKFNGLFIPSDKVY